jgi:hypothetical protein
MPVSSEEILASKARIEDNKQAALDRAAAAAATGNTARQETWLASAARYQTLLDIKDRLAASAERQEKAREEAAARRAEALKPATIIPPVPPSGRREREDTDVVPYTGAPTPSPAPLTPTTVAVTPVATAVPPPPVKTAPIDTILFNDDSVPIEIMTDLIFENIGGQELINIARNDTVNGQNIVYQPIKNLTAIQQQYNPNNIVSLQATSDKYFQNFSIKFEEKVPLEATGPAGAHVYVDSTSGELVVEAVNMLVDEQIEIEVTASGTIYEAEI